MLNIYDAVINTLNKVNVSNFDQYNHALLKKILFIIMDGR